MKLQPRIACWSQFSLGALAAIAAMAAPLQGQSRFGVLAGYSTARAVGELGGTESSPRRGFVPGISGTLMFGDRFGLTLEALEVQKGFTHGAFELKVKYLELPILLTAQYPFGPTKLVIYGGVTVARRVDCSATTHLDDGTNDSNDCIDTDRGVLVPATDNAITAGFGLSWHRWNVSGQYELTGGDYPAEGPDVPVQNRTLILSIGFDILKGKPRE